MALAGRRRPRVVGGKAEDRAHVAPEALAEPRERDAVVRVDLDGARLHEHQDQVGRAPDPELAAERLDQHAREDAAAALLNLVDGVERGAHRPAVGELVEPEGGPHDITQAARRASRLITATTSRKRPRAASWRA